MTGATIASTAQVESVGTLLNNTERPLKERFRALFTLKNIGGAEAIEWISKAFSDESALLKHEVAYCLGQLQDPLAIPVLASVVSDPAREAIVRHEAAEALGAIGGPDVLPVLEKFSSDPVPEVSETCKLALAKLRYQAKEGENLEDGNVYGSVDPAPPSEEQDTDKLHKLLLDEGLPLFDRYRAMFSLRNKADDVSVKALASGLTCTSALFRHEVAFVLGQVASPCAVSELVDRLRDTQENPMVRHECAEALGGIASPGVDVETELARYLSSDIPAVVRESCVVALDMADYNNSTEFQNIMARRAAGLVIFRQGGRGVEWLLLQTSYGQNHWTPPKGHLDPGEDDMMAAMRETEEEAGLGSDQLEVFKDVTAELKYEAFGKPKIVTYWLAKLRDPDQAVTLSEEHQDLRWLPCEEAAQLAGFKDLARVIRDFHEKVVAGQL